ncbi:hypothetical protein ACOMHN_031551 [Nucella lapillus]
MWMDAWRRRTAANEKTPAVDPISFEEIKRKSNSGSPKKRKKKKKKKSKGKVKDKSKSKDKAKRREKAAAAASKTELNGDVPILGTAVQVQQDALSTADSSSSSEDEAASEVNDSEEERKAKLKVPVLEPVSEPPKRVEAIKVKIPRGLATNPDPQSSSDSSSSGESSTDEDSEDDGSSEEEDQNKGGVMSFDPASLNEPLFPDLTPTGVVKKPVTTVLTKKESSSEDDEPLANINRKQPSNKKEPSTELDENQKRQYDNKITNCITDSESKPDLSALVHEDSGAKSKYPESSTEHPSVINQFIPKAVSMDMGIPEEVPQEKDRVAVTNDILSEHSEAKDNSVPMDVEMRDTTMCHDTSVIPNQPEVGYMQGKVAENVTENTPSETSQEASVEVAVAAPQHLFSFAAPLLTSPASTITDHPARTEDLSSQTTGHNISQMDFTTESLRPKTPLTFEPATAISETATTKTSTPQIMSMETSASETSVIRTSAEEFPVTVTTPSEANPRVCSEPEKVDEEGERAAPLEQRLGLFGQETVAKDDAYGNTSLHSASVHDTAISGPQAGGGSPRDVGQDLGAGSRTCGSDSHLFYSGGHDDCGGADSGRCGLGGGDSDLDHGRANFAHENGDFGRENGDFGRENGDFGRENGDFGREDGDLGSGKSDCGGGSGGGDCGVAERCADGSGGECEDGDKGDCDGGNGEEGSDRHVGDEGEGGGGDGGGEVEEGQECGGGGSSDNSNAGGEDAESRGEDNLAAASSQLSKIAKQERKPNGNKLSRLSNIIDNLRVTKEKQVLTGEGEKRDSPDGTTAAPSPLHPRPPKEKGVSGPSFTPLPPVPVLHSAAPLPPVLLPQHQHQPPHHQPPVIARIPSPSRQPASSPSRQLPSPSRQLPSPSRQLPSPSRRHVSPPGIHPSPSVQQHASPTPGSRKSAPAWPLSFTSSSAVSPYPGSSLLSSFALSLPPHTSGSSSKSSRPATTASATSCHQSSSAPPSVLSSSRPLASSALSSANMPSILSLSSTTPSSSLPSMLSLTTAPPSSSSSSSSLSSMLSLTSSLPSMLSFSSPSMASASPLLVGSASSSAYARQQEQLALSLQQAMTRVMTPSDISHAQLMAFQMAQNEAALQQASYIQKMMDMHKLSTSMSLHSKAERDYQMAALSALMPWPQRPDLLNPFHPLAHPHLLAAQQQQYQQQAREKELELEKQKQQQKQREREQQQKRERERERERDRDRDREQQKHRQEQLERKQSQQRQEQQQQQQYKLKHLAMMQEQQRKLDAAHLQFQRDMAKRPYDALTASLALPAEQPQKAHSEAKKPRTSLPGAYPPPPLVPPSTKPRPSHTKVNGSSSSSSSSSKSGSSTHTPPALNPFNLPLPLPVSPVAAPRMWSSCFPHPLPAPSLEAAHLSHLYGLSEEASKHLAQAAISANSRTAHTTGRAPSAASATAPPSSSSSSLSSSSTAGGGEVLDLSVSKR